MSWSKDPAAAVFAESGKIKDRLPNGSVGKVYDRPVLALFGEEARKVTELKVAFSTECGLSFFAEENALKGTPTLAGEFTVTLEFRHADAINSPQTCAVGLTINPDPNSLWKSPPSDAAGRFARADHAALFLETPVLATVAASLRGRSHAQVGGYRDDDFALRFLPKSGWHLFVVADGAGSAKYSRRGAELACATMIAALETSLEAKANDSPGEFSQAAAHELLAAAAHRALAAISMEAGDQGSIRDFATTLICVLARKKESRWVLGAFSVGDGVAAAVFADGVERLTHADAGVFAGQTTFLTTPTIFSDPEALRARTKVVEREDLLYLALMTDGVSDPLFASDAACSDPAAWQHWQSHFSKAVSFSAPEPGMELALLEALKFPSPGHHDDRTLLLAVPKAV